MLRLFFALWPNDAVRAQLALQRDLLAQEYRGIPTRTHRFHLTLVFLDGVREEDLPAFMACGDGIATEPFVLRVDARSHFAHGIGWLGCTDPPPALAALQHALQTRVEETMGIRFTRPFNPHITAARKCAYLPPPAPLTPAIEWPVDNFVLVHSILEPQRSRYDVLKTWPLTPTI